METEFGGGSTNQAGKNLLSEEHNQAGYNLTVINQNFEILRNIGKRKNSKIMLFFHGNAEDLGLAHRVLNSIKNQLKITVLAVEYSGYGLYNGEKSANAVLSDCLTVYDYITTKLGVAEKDIILFGRSIGSSPSCYIAKKRPNVGAMILMSPFKSLRDIAKDRVGKLLSYLLADRYRNIDLITQIKCPILIIHGKSDTLIDVSHSIALQESAIQSSFCQLVTPESMDHNNFKLQDDLIRPFKAFFKEASIRLHHTDLSTKQMIIPFSLFQVPKQIHDFDFKVQKIKYKNLYAAFLQEPHESRVRLSKSSQVKLVSDRERKLIKSKTKAIKRQNLSLNLISNEEFDNKKRNKNRTHHPLKTKISSLDLSQGGLNQKNFSIIPSIALNSFKKVNISKAKLENQPGKVQFYPEENDNDSSSYQAAFQVLDQELSPYHNIQHVNKKGKMSNDWQNTIEQTQQKRLKQSMPNKYLQQDHNHSSIRSFHLSPHSVKQSLPPESIEGGSLTFISYEQSLFSKISCNQIQELKHQRHLKKLSLLEEYNQYATNRPSRHLSQLDNYSLSYIDLLNEDNNIVDTDIERRQTVEGDDIPQLYTMEQEAEHCLQLILANSEEKDKMPKVLVSQLHTLKNDVYEDDMENKHETSISSDVMKRNFQMLDLHINENLIKVTSDIETLLTSNSKIEMTENREFQTNCIEGQHSLVNQGFGGIKNPSKSKIYHPIGIIKHKKQSDPDSDNSKQYQSNENTQTNNSIEYMTGVNEHHDKIRHYKQTKSSNSLSVFGSNRFKNNLSIGNGQKECNIQLKNNEGFSMFMNKKLASPVKCKNFRGDNNDDIPLQMTEDQPVNIITHMCPDGGCQNTMVSDFPHERPQMSKRIKITKIKTEMEVTQKQQKLLKNIKNFNKHQSNLFKKQQQLLTEIIKDNDSDKNVAEKEIKQKVIYMTQKVDPKPSIQIKKQHQTINGEIRLKNKDSSNELLNISANTIHLSLENQTHSAFLMNSGTKKVIICHQRNIVGHCQKPQQRRNDDAPVNRNSTTMQTQPQTYMTTKIGHTNHTIGTGLVTALDTFTYHDEGANEDIDVQGLVGVATGLPSEHNNSSLLLGKSSYEQQRLAIQQNRLSRCNVGLIKRTKLTCNKEVTAFIASDKDQFGKINEDTLDQISDATMHNRAKSQGTQNIIINQARRSTSQNNIFNCCKSNTKQKSGSVDKTTKRRSNNSWFSCFRPVPNQ